MKINIGDKVFIKTLNVFGIVEATFIESGRIEYAVQYRLDFDSIRNNWFKSDEIEVIK